MKEWWRVYILHESSKTYTGIKLMVIDNVLRKLINVMTKIVTIFWDFFPLLTLLVPGCPTND